MSVVQVENLEKNMAKLTVTVPADKLEKAIQEAYNKQKNSIRVPGFRKGKVPRAMIEKAYGPEVFYDDAANILVNEEYPDAMEESGLDIVSRPQIEVTQIEKGQEFIFEAEVAVKPDVTLGEYKGVAVPEMDISVTEEEVDADLEKTRNMQSRMVEVTDRAVEQGDTVVIDYEGFVDGKPFEGGKDENHSLEIGSHSFIDTFEDQIVGKNAVDAFDVNVTFPEQYHAKEMQGKQAVFKVVLHTVKVKEVPELDDEFASMVSEFETLAEYREDVKNKLQERKKDETRRKKEEAAVKKIVENSQMDLPDPMIDMQCDNIIQELVNRISQQGLSFQQYLQFTGLTREKLQEQVRPEAIQRIQNSLVLEKVAQVENLEATEEEVDAEIGKAAAAYGMSVEKMMEFVSEDGRDEMKKDLAIQKAVDFIMEHATEVSEENTAQDTANEAGAAES